MTRRLGLLVFGLLLLALVPSALATNVNITIEETVNQNVTFARDFFLVENRTFSLIEGVITVNNPDTETIFDIHIRLDNVTNLASDVVYVSGREGFQVVYPNETSTPTVLTENITTSFTQIDFDLDEDGINDSVRHNDTHMIWNISSEYTLFSIPFENSTNTSLDISAPPVPLSMNYNLVSNRVDLEYNDGVQFANIQVTGTVSTASVLDPAEVVITINDSQRDFAILRIPELRAGQETVFNYNISSASVDPPLDIDTEYTNPEFETKVLAGERFGIRLTATNIATVGDLTNVNITLQAENVTVVNGSSSLTFNFTLQNLSNLTATSDDFDWVDNSSNRTWQWTVNNGTIPIGQSYNISFQMEAPETVNSSGTFLALTQTLAYQINTTGSTLAVGQVRARGAIGFNETKRIVSPQDNLSNNNVTWQSIPTVGTSENISYTVEKVTLWVTSVRDPNQKIPGLEFNYTPNQDIGNSTAPFVGSPWLFNFTDGSSDANPPPIVWIKPYWIIKNVDNQIINSSVTVNGTDLYMNYIYVVNGYWLEVQKQVLDSGNSTFQIRTEVRNRGNGYTPQNLTVTIFDFVPSEFTAWNFSPSPDNQSNVTGEFGGVAYQWDVGLRTNISTSFAPRGDPSGLDYFWVNYTVNGTGNFAVSDLYIVGLDPRAIDGANAYTGVRVVSAFASTSREVIYLSIVFFLIAINVANFLMTSRINKKLK